MSVGNAGVYVIKCNATGEIYVGCSTVINRRKHQHWWDLNHGRHVNKMLSRRWLQYGEGAFEFLVVARPSLRRLLTVERWFIASARSMGGCMNERDTPVCRARALHRRPENVVINDEQWRNFNNVELARLTGLHALKVRRMRPANIPSPAKSLEWIVATARKSIAVQTDEWRAKLRAGQRARLVNEPRSRRTERGLLSWKTRRQNRKEM